MLRLVTALSAFLAGCDALQLPTGATGATSRRQTLATGAAAALGLSIPTFPAAWAYDSIEQAPTDFAAQEKVRAERQKRIEGNKKAIQPYLTKISKAETDEEFANACDELSLWIIGKGRLPEGIEAPLVRDVIQDAYNAKRTLEYRCKTTRSGKCFTKSPAVEGAFSSVIGELRKSSSKKSKGALQSDGVSAANSAAF